VVLSANVIVIGVILIRVAENRADEYDRARLAVESCPQERTMVREILLQIKHAMQVL
jgi:hypothetical protein